MNNTLARMQTLVGEAGARAGEALGLTEDPFSTVVGCRVSAEAVFKKLVLIESLTDTRSNQR